MKSWHVLLGLISALVACEKYKVFLQKYDPNPDIFPPKGAVLDTLPALRCPEEGGAKRYAFRIIRDGEVLAQAESEGPEARFGPEAFGRRGRYFWQFRFLREWGWSKWSDLYPFTLSLPLPPELESPADGEEVGNIPELSWMHCLGAKGYNLQVSEDEGFSSVVLDEEGLKGGSYTPGLPLPKGRYWWRVRTVDADGPGRWSHPRSFVVGEELAVPSLEGPVGGEEMAFPVLRWRKIEGIGEYQVQVDEDSGFGSPEEAVVRGTTYVPELPAGEYYWRVRGRNLVGWGEWSDVGSFRVVAPGLVSPGDGDVLRESPVELSWGVLEGAVGYEVQVSSEVSFSSPEMRKVEGNSCSLELADGEYWWRVRGKDQEGNPGAWSEVRSFTLVTLRPGVPVVTSPQEGSWSREGEVSFLWEPVEGATGYQVQVDDADDFSSPEVDEYTDSPSYSCTLADGRYYWKVRAKNLAGWGGWSEARSFGVDTSPPPAPVLESPDDEEEVEGPDVTLRWERVEDAAMYRLQVSMGEGFASTLVDTEVSVTEVELRLKEGRYWWRVGAVDPAGNWSGWSDVRDFVVLPPKGVIEIEVPWPP